MKKLMFVDDKPKLLDGLKRSLRSMREEWNMTFVTSGAEALQALEQAPFDVIVSDMRMPVMDGVQLLNEVRQRFLQAVRIVLSGQSDKELIYQSIAASDCRARFRPWPRLREKSDAIAEAAYSLCR